MKYTNRPDQPKDHRPFKSQDEMHEVLIANWNAVAKPEDHVWCLGDFAFASIERCQEIFRQLNGHKCLVIGNHDFNANVKKAAKVGWIEVHAGPIDWHVKDIHVVMCHYPYGEVDHTPEVRFKERRPKDQGSFLLHGHVHTAWKKKGRMINVGVDAWNQKPVSEDELYELLTREGARTSDIECPGYTP